MDNNSSNKSLLSQLPKPPDGKMGWPWTVASDISSYDLTRSWPKISIITPSFNQAHYIEETIRSVILQQYPNLEFLVIDGGSKDGTVEILKKYEPWIDKWISEKDSGQTDAINKGLKLCSGEIFNWLNSDDYYYEECLFKLAGHFQDENVDVVAGKYRFFDNAGINADRFIGTPVFATLSETFCKSLLSQPSTFFRLNKIKELGPLSEELHFVMDQDMWIKYLLKNGKDKIKITDDLFTHFRVHEESKTNHYRNNLFIKEHQSIFYSIAVQNGLSKQAEAINKLSKHLINKDFRFVYNFQQSDVSLARQLINDFLYFRAVKSFKRNLTDDFDICYSALDLDCLPESNAKSIMQLNKVKKYNFEYRFKTIIKSLKKIKEKII